MSMRPAHHAMLDGMRGYAAFVVLIYHLRHFFADLPPVANGFLAVDLFFMMSGFVLALSYEARLRSGALTLRAFARRRVLRLYPVYLTGLVLGLAVSVVIAAIDGWLGSVWVLVPPLVSGVVMAPDLILRGPNGPFPLNPPAWSLFFEFWGNLFYAGVAMRLGTRALAMTVAAALLIYILSSQIAGTVELGVTYAHFVSGVVRFWFGFGVGVLIWRLRDQFPDLGWARGPVLIAAMAFGAVPDSDVWRFVWIAAVLPMGVIAALGLPLRAGVAAVCGHLGRLSYPLYLLHWPVMLLCIHVAVAIWSVAAWRSPLLGALIVVAACGLAAAVTYGVEPRLRRWLDARLSPCR
ncbi:MAG TPA: acyltransferase [Paenirhodobacter sp.]